MRLIRRRQLNSYGLKRNLRLLFLLYWMTPLITPGTAWLARAGVESRINKTNNNNQVRVIWEKKEKQL